MASADPSQSTWSVLMLSDLFKLFEPARRPNRGPNPSVQRQNHITMKISFYAAHILSTPSTILSGLSDEILARSNLIKQELFPSPSDVMTNPGPHASYPQFGNRPAGPRLGLEQNTQRVSKIEELP
jgi:hypothetical protein